MRACNGHRQPLSHARDNICACVRACVQGSIGLGGAPGVSILEAVHID
jgi:hypothetical protein